MTNKKNSSLTTPLGWLLIERLTVSKGIDCCEGCLGASVSESVCVGQEIGKEQGGTRRRERATVLVSNSAGLFLCCVAVYQLLLEDFTDIARSVAWELFVQFLA